MFCLVTTITIYLFRFKDRGKVGRLKPPPFLTGGFNQLKQPWSICQKVVNTGQYESEWSIEIFKWPFRWWIEIFGQVYILFIEKRKKYCFVPAEATFKF